MSLRLMTTDPPEPVPVSAKFSRKKRRVPALLSRFHILLVRLGRVKRSVEVPPEYPRRNCPRRSSFDPGVEVPMPTFVPLSTILPVPRLVPESQRAI